LRDDEGLASCCRCGPFRVRFFPPGLLRPFLLRLLAEGPKTGFALINEVTRRTNGRWSPGPAAVYPALRDLAEKGFVHRATAGSGHSRAYSLTPKGRKVVGYWEEMRKSGRDELRILARIWEEI
jgi:DNA-binding PadR family transcriptional regulator